MTTRRTVLAGAGALVAAGCALSPRARHADTAARLDEIEAGLGGARLGVFAIDSGTGAVIARREDERFAMCSTFKWLLAAAILKRADEGRQALDQAIEIRPGDILGNSPKTEAALARGGGTLGSMTVEELCEAAVKVSDNAAANHLFARLAGPKGLLMFTLATGDNVTRFDRIEPQLNENAPGDIRDTTSPRAMAETTLKILADDRVLTAASREKLTGWMIASTTGLNRLRGGLPKDWRAGDKTGTGGNGSTNDVAIAWPAGRRPIAIACYISEGGATLDQRIAAHAEVGRLVAGAFG